jgi:hypothetical protein
MHVYDAREAEPVLPPGQEALALQELEMPEQRRPVVQEPVQSVPAGLPESGQEPSVVPAAEALQPD